MKTIVKSLLSGLLLPVYAQTALQPELLLLEDGKKISITAQAPEGYEALDLSWDFRITTETGTDSGTLPRIKCNNRILKHTAALPELPERTRFVLHAALIDQKGNTAAHGIISKQVLTDGSR